MRFKGSCSDTLVLFVGAPEVSHRNVWSQTYPMRSSSAEPLRRVFVCTGPCMRTPDDVSFSPRQKPASFRLFCRSATKILKTLVSDQARLVWQLLNPCRSVRRRSNSTERKKKKKRPVKRENLPSEAGKAGSRLRVFKEQLALSLLLL